MLTARWIGAFALGTVLGCASILGVDGDPDGDGDGSAGTPDAAGAGGSSSSSSSGSSSSGGSGGSGGSPDAASGGIAALRLCDPGVESPCPLDPCGRGHWTCNAAGNGFGACQGTAVACTGTPEWSKRFGNTGNGGQSETLGGATGAAGALYLSGSLKKDIDFDGDVVLAPLPNSSRPTSAYLTKLGLDGGVQWTKPFRAATEMIIRDIASDPLGNVVVVGNSDGQTFDLGDQAQTGSCSFIASYAPDGSRRFVHTYCDGFAPILTHVAVAPDGAILVGGTSIFSFDLGGGEYPTFGGSDVAVLALEPDGSFRWSRNVGSGENEHLTGFAVDPSTGDVLLGIGARDQPVDFGAGTTGAPEGPHHVALGRLARADGAALWSTRVDGVSGTFARDILPALDGGFVWTFAGTGGTAHFSNGDFVTGEGFVVRYAADGSIDWIRKLTGNLVIRSGNMDLAGNVVIGGARRPGVVADLGEGPVDWSGGEVVWSESSTDSVPFVAKYSPLGDLRWARTFGDSSSEETLDQQVGAIVIEPGGELTLFGQFLGTMPLGTPSLLSGGGHGGTDVFVARLAP